MEGACDGFPTGLCAFGNNGRPRYRGTNPNRPPRDRTHRRGRPSLRTPVNRLLFIEDDDEIRLVIRLALEDEGYQVDEAR